MKRRAGPLLLLAFLSATALSARPGCALAAVEWAADTLTTFEGVARSVDRGSLSVPEDRAKPNGPRVHLGFVRMRATGTPTGAPLVFLAGGPGVPASFMARVPNYDRLFQRLRASGDVILVDQRGCGLSNPALVCMPKEPLPGDTFVSEARARSVLDGALASCAASIRERGVRPEAYHNRASSEDLDNLRLALGVPRLRLLAFAAGTELAQDFLRVHGDRVERAVMVSTRAPDEAWRLPAVFDFHVRRLARFVARDSVYASRFPDLEAAIRAATDSLAAHPRTIPVVDRHSGTTVEVVAGGFALQLILQGDLMDPFGFAAAPALLATLKDGDDSIFAVKLGQLYNNYSGVSNVEVVAIDCASGADSERVRRMTREANQSSLGGARILLQRPELCREIGAADLGEEYRQHVYSNVPTLFLSGSYDGNTPPYQAEEVRWGFPNGIHLVVAGGWHELLPAPDVQQTVADYMAGIDVAGRKIALPPPRFLSIADVKSLLGAGR